MSIDFDEFNRVMADAEKELSRMALVLDAPPFRIRIEYPSHLDQHGRERIMDVMAEPARKLREIAEISDPSSPSFKAQA